MKTLAKYYLKYWALILTSIIFLIGEALCELQIPGYMSDIISYGVALSDNDAIKKYGIYMLIYTLGAGVCAIIVGFTCSRAAAYISKDIRNDYFKKVISFSSQEFNKYELSSLITRGTNDITQIQNFIVTFLRLSMFIPIMGIGGIIKALEYSSNIEQVKYIIIGGVVFVFIILLLSLIIVLPKMFKMQKQVDDINKISKDNLNGNMVVRAFNNEKYMEDKFDDANKSLTKTTTIVNKITAVMIPGLTTIMFVISILLLVIVSKFATKISQIANMMAFLQYALQIIISFTSISMVFLLTPRAMVAAKRIREVLSEDISIKESNDLNLNFSDSIEFKNVSYVYQNGVKAIDDISFEIKKGEKVAIVGTTGSGKSTLVKMIPRLLDSTSGEILIDGKNNKEYSLKSLRDSIGFVPQKSVVFSGSIKDNILYGVLDESSLDDASFSSNSDVFINDIENKYDYVICEGGNNISGGQKQRLTIARAFAKNSPIYIFDDSFSSLDFKTDAFIRDEIKQKYNDSSIIIVAQRIGTIKNADKIIMMDKGKIVGIGSHHELIKNCKEYLDLAKTQLSMEELK